MDHNNGLLVNGSDCLDEFIAIVPWVQVLPVACIALDFDVAFARIRVDANDGNISPLSCGCALLGVVVGGSDDICAIFLGLTSDSVQRCDEILEKY